MEQVSGTTVISMRLLALALPFALLAATPATAADIATLNCVDQSISAPLRAQLVADFEKQLRTREYGIAPALSSQVLEVSKTCASRHGWSAEAAEAARVNLFASIGLPIAERVAKAGGIDTAKIWEMWRGLPESVRQNRLDEAMLAKITGDLMTSGVIADIEGGKLAGQMLAFMNIGESSRRRFIEA